MKKKSDVPDRVNRKVKLTRAEHNEVVKRRLFDAAAKIVGQFGYAEASVARITMAAGIAQGSFYNHFENRQQLLDELLPTLGAKMLVFLNEKARAAGSPVEEEIERFTAFFDFARESPGFVRVLNEAELFAPVGYKRLLKDVCDGYLRALKRRRGPGGIGDFTDEELEIVVQILLGARRNVVRLLAGSRGKPGLLPDHARSAYAKLIARGLFWDQ